MGRKIETNAELIDRTMSAIATRKTELNMRKDSALSSFRVAAEELRFVNEGLTETAEVADSMVRFFAEHKANAEQAIADNTAVANRILEIIGG